MGDIKKQIESLIKMIGEGIWEKEDIFSLALLSSIAGERIFLLGPPGTGKSMAWELGFGLTTTMY